MCEAKWKLVDKTINDGCNSNDVSDMKLRDKSSGSKVIASESILFGRLRLVNLILGYGTSKKLNELLIKTRHPSNPGGLQESVY